MRVSVILDGRRHEGEATMERDDEGALYLVVRVDDWQDLPRPLLLRVERAMAAEAERLGVREEGT